MKHSATISRRLFGFLAFFALVAALIPLAACAQNAAPAMEYDVKAEAILQAAADRMRDAPSLSGSLVYTTPLPANGGVPARTFRSVNRFRMQKPNFVYSSVAAEIQNSDGTTKVLPATKYVSDGKKGAMISLTSKTYHNLPVTMEALTKSYALQFPEFFDTRVSDAQQTRDAKARGSIAALRVAPDAEWGDVLCAVVESTRQSKTNVGETVFSTTKIYVGKKDSIPRGYRTEQRAPSGGTQVSETVITDVRAGDAIPASVFAIDLTGYQEIAPPTAWDAKRTQSPKP